MLGARIIRVKAAPALLGALLAFGAAPVPAQNARDAAPVSAVADRRLAVTTPAGAAAFTLYISQDWDRPLPAVRRAVITVHGARRDAEIYRAAAEKALTASGIDAASVLLIEPQFLSDADVAAHHLPAETLHWSAVGWEGGDDAHGPAPTSSFAVLDAMLARLADRGRFPALQTVVVAGHSGGGQVVQRYAVASRGEAALTAAGIHIRYVVANPSSYVYFSPERPAGDGFAPFDAAACPGYDRWKYGMAGLPPYLADVDAAALEKAYVARDVVYLLGTADTNPNHPALDKSCMAEAEGPYRLARGLAYFRYLQQRHPAGFTQRLLQVPGVGHDGERMFNSACGLAALYDLPGCDSG